MSNGTDRILIVGVGLDDSGYTVTGVTYGGTALTLIGTKESANSRMALYYLINPTVGTANVVVTISGATDISVGAVSLTGVDQSTPLGTFVSAAGTNTASPSVTVSSATSELVLETVAIKSPPDPGTLGSGQTSLWSLYSSGAYSSAGSTKAGASSVTMSRTLTGNGDWAIGAVPLKPSAQPIAADGSSSAQEDYVATNPALTWSHTVGTGANRLLFVSVSLSYSGTTVSGITYGGVSLTSVGSTNAPSLDGRVEIWKLVNPASGTANIAVSLVSGDLSVVVGGALSFSNVNQTTPIRTFAAASGFNSSDPSVAVSSATGDLVADVVMWNNTSALTVGTSQTQKWNRAGFTMTGAGSTEAGASSVTMSWTHAAATDSWAIGAVSVQPASGIQADVATTKTGPTNVVAGAKVTYTITVTNSGSSTATNVAVTDPLPTGVAFLSATSGGTSNSGAVTWSTFNLASGTSTNFTLNVTAPASGSITNTVSSTATTTDPDSSNNDGSASGAKVVTTVTPQSNVGNANSSCVTATNVSTKTWSHTVSSGNNRVLLVGFSFANTSRTVSSVTYGGASLSYVGRSAVNRGLEIWKLVNPGVGTSNIIATWSGNVDVALWSASFTNVDQTSPLGAFQSASGSSTTPSVTVGSATGDLVVDVIAAAGDAGTLTPTAGQTTICSGFTGTGSGDARGGGTYKAGASSVTMSWTLGASKVWDIGAVPIRVAAPIQADVGVVKSGASTVYGASNLTYTITVTNCGPSTASNLVVKDILPTNVVFVSASSGGTSNNGVVTWPTLTNFAYSATTNFTVTITAPLSGWLTNTASGTATTGDPDALNNNGTASNAKVITAILQIADVRTTKAGAASVYETSNLTYTITVTNLGPNTATNVIVSDLLPDEFAFVSASGGGTNDDGTVIWPTMTNCAVGFTTNFTVTVTAPTNGVSLTNIVSSTATSTDPDASNNDGSSASARVTTTVTPIADVKTTKTGAATVTATSNLTYAITVTNLGPDIATNLIVSDLLPTNVTFVTASSGGTNGNGTVWWGTITNFALGATTNFTVTVTAPASGTLTNTVSSTAATTDPDASNNNGSAVAAKVITTVTPLADVKTTKSGAATVTATSNLTYTITVTNLGPSTASNIVVSDVLPTNAVFVSASGGGSHSNGVVTWSILSSLANTATNFTVTVTAPTVVGTVSNIVASTSSTSDPDASNNNGSAAASRVVTAVVAGPLHHFAFAAIGTQTYASPFAVTLTAQDANNNTVTGFGGTVGLTTTANTISPAVSGAFVSGVLTQSVTVTLAGSGQTITATRSGGSETGTSAAFTVNPAPLTVTANDTNRVYGATNPTFTASYSGFVNGDTAGVVQGVPGFSTAATTNSPVGTYAITPALGSLTATNYSFTTFNDGTLTVGKASSTNVVATSANPSPTGSNVTFTATLTAVAPGGGTPSGTVQFLSDGVALGAPVALSGGVATLVTNSLAHGTHTITARYAGGGNFFGRTNSLSPDQVINTAPVAGNDGWLRFPTSGAKARVATLLANDTDADGDTLTLSSVSATSAQGGTITTNTWVFYTPPGGFTNADSFTYVVTDGGLLATGSVAITIVTNLDPSQNALPTEALGNGDFRTRFRGIAVRAYTIQYTTNLATPNWQALGMATADFKGQFEFTDSPAPNSPPRFYRSIHP